MTPESVKVSLQWCLKAGQILSGTQGSNTLDPSGVFTQDPATNTWLKQRLNATLGTEEVQPQPVWPCPVQMPPAQQLVVAPAGPTQSQEIETYSIWASPPQYTL